MELVKAEEFTPPTSFKGMSELPVVRQIGLLIGLAASIALGISVVLWSQTADYTVLYANMNSQDTREIANVLTSAGIEYRLDPDSGTVMVDSSKVNQAKLKLAEHNLPGSAGTGFELIEKDQGFGASAFLQTARYHRAQEGELARTITSISAVQSARVHLALPKESAFIRSRRKATASVMLKLFPGRQLEKAQIAAITNLVASSVQNMEASQVTVVDDKGRMLSSGQEQRDMALTASQFEYTNKLEQTFIERIENILSPLVGLNRVRAQVTADMDFTRTEYTQETYNPDLPAVRSEQAFEESSTGSVNEGGVPGALSNEPPGQAVAPEDATTATANATAVTPSKVRRRSTKNFELDKTISHTRSSPGNIRRLSIAVVLDVKQSQDEEGNTIKAPYSAEELARFTSLVKEAVGFNVLRGDTVNVINAEFTPVEIAIEDIPEEPFWEKSWFWSVLKQLGAAAVILLLLFKVLRPVMHNLATRPKMVVMTESGEEIPEDQLTLSADGQPRLPKPTGYEDNLNMAKQLAAQEPKRVAQVVKGWLDDSKKT